MTHVDHSETGRLGSNQTATPRQSFACQASFPLGGLRFVCAEKPTNLTGRNANVAGGHVGIGANVFAQLPHERDAEFANLIVRFALGIEIGSTLTAADAHYIEGSVTVDKKFSFTRSSMVSKRSVERATHIPSAHS